MDILFFSENFPPETNAAATRVYERAVYWARWGHNVTVIDYMRCYITIDSKRKGIFFNGKLIKKVDAIVPRIGASNTLYGTSIVRQFELLGTYCLNSSSSIISISLFVALFLLWQSSV